MYILYVCNSPAVSCFPQSQEIFGILLFIGAAANTEGPRPPCTPGTHSHLNCGDIETFSAIILGGAVVYIMLHANLCSPKYKTILI